MLLNLLPAKPIQLSVWKKRRREPINAVLQSAALKPPQTAFPNNIIATIPPSAPLRKHKLKCAAESLRDDPLRPTSYVIQIAAPAQY